MFNSFYIMYADYFNKLNEEGKDGYILLKSTVCIILLCELYKKFTSQTEEPITSLEDLPLDKKTKYWNIAKKYYTEIPDRIKASKCAYTLSLITSTE